MNFLFVLFFNLFKIVILIWEILNMKSLYIYNIYHLPAITSETNTTKSNNKQILPYSIN